MLTDILIDANTIFSRYNFKTIAVFNKENHCVLSGMTEDSLCYFCDIIKEPYTYKEFSFRDWSSITSLLGTFKNFASETDFNIKLNLNEEDYPTEMIFTNGDLKYKHYLQSYSFISKQEDMLNNYKRRKFTLKPADKNYTPDLTAHLCSQMSRISVVMNEKYFHLEQDDNGDLYACYGDSNISADNARALLQKNYEKMAFDKSELFMSSYLTETIKSFDDENYNVLIKPNMILISYDTNTSTKVIAIKSKR